MTHEKCRKLMDAMIDGRLGERACRAFEEHMAGCAACRAELEGRRRMVTALGALKAPEPPAELHHRVHAALDDHLRKEALPMGRKLNLGVLSAVTAGLLLLLVVGTVTLGDLGTLPDAALSAPKENAVLYSGEQPEGGFALAGDIAGDMAAEEEALAAYKGDGKAAGDSATDRIGTQSIAGEGSVLTQDRKIIYTGIIQIRTSRFDEDLAAVRQYCAQAGGYVEWEAVQGLPFTVPDGAGREARIQLRIPREQYESFTATVETLGQLYYSQQSASDITAGYVDTEIRLRTLHEQLNQLEEILDRSEKLEDVVTLVAEISRVTQQIEQTKSQLMLWDNQVAYASVTVVLTEVREHTAIDPTDPTLGSKITDAFFGSLSAIKSGFLRFVVWLVAASPYIVVLLVLAGVVTLIVVPVRRRRMARRAAQTPPEQAE